MCQTILRVTYLGNETKDIAVDETVASLADRIDDLQNKDTVQRIEVFTRTRNITRTATWVETA